MRKKVPNAFVAAFLVLGLGLAPQAAAKGEGKALQGLQPSAESFFQRAGFLLKQKDRLGLSDDQVRAIQGLKSDMRKNLIRSEAEIEIFEIDIFTKLHDETAHPSEVQRLIEQKFDAKKELSQSLADGYFKLRSALSEQQRQALKQMGREWLEAYENRDTKGNA